MLRRKIMKRKLIVSMFAFMFCLSFIAVSTSAEESWWAKAAAPYKGVTLRGITETNPPSHYINDVLLPAFEKETGIKAVFEVTSWDEMYNKSIRDMEAGTGIYDFVYIEQDIIFSYLEQEFLTNMSKLIKDKPELTYPDLDLPDFTSFIDYFKDAKGDVFGLPFEAFIKLYFYRTDLFEDPEIKAAFKKQYGWDLRAALTHKEHVEISKFFMQWGQEHNMELWGSTCQAAAGPGSFYEMVETIWPSWGIYNWGINLENMKATSANGGTLDTDRAKEALQWWLDSLEVAPPESRASTWDDTIVTYAGGRTAQAWVLSDNVAWVGADPSRSKIVGKVGIALPPLAEGVLEDAKSGKGYVGYYDGAALGIPHSSRNKEAAWLLIQWVSRKEIQGDFCRNAARIVRKSTLDDPVIAELDPQYGGYFTIFQKYADLFSGAPPLAAHAQVREVMSPYINKAISGEMTPEEALDEAAKAVDEELVRLGYAK